MRDLLKYIMILLLFNSSAINAQTDVKIRKNEFKSDNPAFQEAWKHLNNGDSFFKKGGVWYANAYDEYNKARQYNNSNAELNYKAGVSALYSDNKELAAELLLKSLEAKAGIADDILLLTGRAFQFSGRYSDAIEKFNSYLSSPVKKPKNALALAMKSIDECNSALVKVKDTLRVKIENLGPNINSGSDDYSAILSADGKTLYFGSRRKMTKSGKRYDDTKFDENIFVSNRSNGLWDLSVSAGKNLVSSFCEMPIFIDSAGSTMYIYAGYENGGDIMMTSRKKGTWKSPVQIPYPINSNGSETSFSVSPSGDEVYFISDNGKEIYGGKDIFYIKRTSKKKWSEPMNAGKLINTVYDDESVRLSTSGDTLWFSSKGHGTIGGFDIFYSVRNSSGEWDTVKNCGYPVNTPWDELFYYPAPGDDSSFYFVSNRSGGFGGLDIYRGKWLPSDSLPVVLSQVHHQSDSSIKPLFESEVTSSSATPIVVKHKEPGLYLEGKINDSDSNDPVMARIEIVELKSEKVVAFTESSYSDGTYSIRIPEKKSYKIYIHASGFISAVIHMDIPANWKKDVYYLNVELKKDGISGHAEKPGSVPVNIIISEVIINSGVKLSEGYQ